MLLIFGPLFMGFVVITVLLFTLYSLLQRFFYYLFSIL